MSVTAILFLINLLVFAFSEYLSAGSSAGLPDLAARGQAKAFLAVWNGEVWRLVTALFLHAGWLHLLLNLYGLHVLGHAVESGLGTGRFLIVYFVSGIFGFVISLIFLHPCVPTVGASGALFGLIGALVGNEMRFGRHPFEFLQQDYGRNLVTFAVVNLLAGFLFPNVNNAAHVGGFVMGLLLMQAGLVRPARPLEGPGKLLRAALMILCLEATLYSFFPVFNAYWQYQRFLVAAKAGRTEEAIAARDFAFRLDPAVRWLPLFYERRLAEDSETRQILERYGMLPEIPEQEPVDAESGL